MHDLKLFFWVLFWICVHYSEPNKKPRVVLRFEEWNEVDMEILADLEKRIVSDEGDFKEKMDVDFTLYYDLLGPWMNRLRKVVFPNGRRWNRGWRSFFEKQKRIRSCWYWQKRICRFQIHLSTRSNC